MTEPARRKPPMPLTLAFVACQEIYRDSRTGVSILIGPTSHVPLVQFPAYVRLSGWAEFTGGHGGYQPRLCLLDDADEVVWGWSAPEPFECPNPLLPHQVTFHDLMLAVPKLGKYRLVLQLNGEEIAQRGMWFGPSQAFQE
jgi:hypothetical protein